MAAGTWGAAWACMLARAPVSRSQGFTAAIHELAARPHPAARLDLDGTVLFLNDPWERFARRCGFKYDGEANEKWHKGGKDYPISLVSLERKDLCLLH